MRRSSPSPPAPGGPLERKCPLVRREVESGRERSREERTRPVPNWRRTMHGDEGVHETGPDGFREERDCWEEYWVSGDRVLEKVREIVREGNVRRLIIRNEERRTIVEIPLTVGVVGVMVAPVWAAIGAIAALVSNCSIQVEREEPRMAG